MRTSSETDVTTHLDSRGHEGAVIQPSLFDGTTKPITTEPRHPLDKSFMTHRLGVSLLQREHDCMQLTLHLNLIFSPEVALMF
jgi:hypothetical protein